MTRVLVPLCFLLTFSASGQQRLMDDMKAQEEALYASTKQLNQFFRRFNGEEDEKGERYYPNDRKYRSDRLRKKYLPALFDRQTTTIKGETAAAFVDDMLKNEVFLGLHEPGLVAEVATEFRFNGKSVGVLLYMKLQPQRQGYEWVFEDVSFDEFSQRFNKDQSEAKPFIHPMSHELDFMNLRKALRNGVPESYTEDDFEPDYLTLFIYEINKGNLEFETIRNVKFHLFSLDRWYVEISKFNRPGTNTGWLISNLVAVDQGEKAQLRDYIYGKN